MFEALRNAVILGAPELFTVILGAPVLFTAVALGSEEFVLLSDKVSLRSVLLGAGVVMSRAEPFWYAWIAA